jgi:hypothetical protein
MQVLQMFRGQPHRGLERRIRILHAVVRFIVGRAAL